MSANPNLSQSLSTLSSYNNMWMYKSNNKQLRYQAINYYKKFLANISWMAKWIHIIELALRSTHQTIYNDI